MPPGRPGPFGSNSGRITGSPMTGATGGWPGRVGVAVIGW